MGEPTPIQDAVAKEVPQQQETGSILTILEARRAEALAIEAAKKQLLVIRARARELGGLVEGQLPVTSNFEQNTDVYEKDIYDRKERRMAQSRIDSGGGSSMDSRIAKQRDRKTASIQRRAGKLVSPDGKSVEVTLKRRRTYSENETDDNGMWAPAVDSEGNDDSVNEELTVESLSLTDPSDEGEMLVVYPVGIHVYTPQYHFPEFTILSGGENGLNVVNSGDDRFKIPDRDPLDATMKSLDYFIQHASELKLVQPAEVDGQTPPVPPTPPASSS